tara:strand:+ start:282 stop:935 length:654 start_codon:yes stop_codon:yes gene_type:complete
MTKSRKIKNKISSKKIKKNNQARILHAFIEACFLNHTFYYKIRLEDIEVKIEQDAFLYFENILTYVLSEIIELASQNTNNIIETKNIIDSINNDRELRYILSEFSPPEDILLRYSDHAFIKPFSKNEMSNGFLTKKMINKIISEIVPGYKLSEDAHNYIVKLFTMLGNKIAYFTINIHKKKQNIMKILIKPIMIQKATELVFYEPTLYFYKFLKKNT